MNAEKTFSSRRSKNKTIFWMIGIILIMVLAGAYVRLFVFNDKAQISSEFINSTLSKASELTTAKLNTKGIYQYSDEGTPVISKADFIMVYRATVRAGIDVNEIKTTVDNDKRIVWLTIPDAVIQEVKVDPASIKYYDEKFTLFNLDEKEDANKAQKKAEEDASEEAYNMGILELADKQSEALIKGILEDAIPKDYEIKIKK